MSNINRLIELLVLIKSLVEKGMPGFYISRPFVPIENVSVSLEIQERFFIIKSVRSDLANMKLNPVEKTDLQNYLNELEQLTMAEGAGEIWKNVFSRMDSAIKDVLKNRSNESSDSADK